MVHTHSTYATAFAVKGLEIPPVVTESVFYKDKTTVIGYGKPGSRELAEKVTAGISEDTDVLILEKHGDYHGRGHCRNGSKSKIRRRGGKSGTFIQHVKRE